MKIYLKLKCGWYTAAALAMLLMSGCGTSGTTSPQTGGTVNVHPLALLASIQTAVSNPINIARSLESWDWLRFGSSFGTLLSSVSNTIDMQKITYQSIGADGQVHPMTGLLILPRTVAGPRPTVPIFMLQHGTETYRPYSPSQFLLHLDRPTDYPEVMVAAAIASTGYAVAMADYEGMGDNSSPQPYMNGAVLARQVIDMLRASRDLIATTASPCTWNKQLFLMGYSEGGYVTLAATRELQLRNSSEFTVTAAAALSGPHDLSGTMRNLMLSNSTSKAPYFLPFLLTGYNYSYGSIFSPATTMISPFNSNIPQLFTGITTSDKISEAMGMVFNPLKLIVPNIVLTTSFATQLNSDRSIGSAYSFLYHNDAFRDPFNKNVTWKPTIPLRMYHHQSDDLVPYNNSQIAFDAFSSVGGKRHGGSGPGVELVWETLNISLSKPSNTIHVGAAIPELSNGWNWLNSFKK